MGSEAEYEVAAREVRGGNRSVTSLLRFGGGCLVAQTFRLLLRLPLPTKRELVFLLPPGTVLLLIAVATGSWSWVAGGVSALLGSYTSFAYETRKGLERR